MKYTDRELSLFINPKLECYHELDAERLLEEDPHTPFCKYCGKELGRIYLFENGNPQQLTFEWMLIHLGQREDIHKIAQRHYDHHCFKQGFDYGIEWVDVHNDIHTAHSDIMEDPMSAFRDAVEKIMELKDGI